MKKLLFGTLFASMAAIMSIVPVFAQNTSNTSANGNGLAAGSAFPTQNYSDDLAVSKGSSCGADTPVLICGIKRIINWILGLLALVALVILLYAGFKMLTAGGDAK